MNLTIALIIIFSSPLWIFGLSYLAVNFAYKMAEKERINKFNK